MSGFDLIHLPCPCGQSSDAYAINENKWGYCFSCSKSFPPEGGIPIDKKDDYRIYPHRNISEKTFNFYNIKTKFVDDEPVEVGFRYPNESYKIRELKQKNFRTYGPIREAGLFGKDHFDPGSKESITITEGEYDALSVYEMIGKTAACSVRSASSAFTDCSRDRDYINSFKRIILCFDADEVGQEAAKKVATLFDFNKVYHVKFHTKKDANEFLQNEDAYTFRTLWENAKRYSPDNIISQFIDIEKSLSVSNEDQIGTYPFSRLQEATYGLHRGEVIVVKAPRGAGKTELFRAMEHHLLKTTDHNIGIIHLEEDNATTVKAIAGYELKAPAVLPDSGLSKSEIFEAYKKAVGNKEDRVHIYESFEVEDEDILYDNIRFLVTAAGCSFIFLDHITWLATGRSDSDERIRLDRISQRLKLLAKELKFCLIMISHVNVNGVTRGSANIENVANTIISIARDHLSQDDLIKRTTNFMLEKVRLGGKTGNGGCAIFDVETNVLREPTQKDLSILPEIGE